MRDKIVWAVANLILNLASKRYRERLRACTDIALFVAKDEELFNLVFDKARAKRHTIKA